MRVSSIWYVCLINTLRRSHDNKNEPTKCVDLFDIACDELPNENGIC